MARIGRLGHTITQRTKNGYRVTSIDGSFRGTVWEFNGGLKVSISNNGFISWPDLTTITMRGAIRRLRQAAHAAHLEATKPNLAVAVATGHIET